MRKRKDEDHHETQEARAVERRETRQRSIGSHSLQYSEAALRRIDGRLGHALEPDFLAGRQRAVLEYEVQQERATEQDGRGPVL